MVAFPEENNLMWNNVFLTCYCSGSLWDKLLKA